LASFWPDLPSLNWAENTTELTWQPVGSYAHFVNGPCTRKITVDNNVMCHEVIHSDLPGALQKMKITVEAHPLVINTVAFSVFMERKLGVQLTKPDALLTVSILSERYQTILDHKLVTLGIVPSDTPSPNPPPMAASLVNLTHYFDWIFAPLTIVSSFLKISELTKDASATTFSVLHVNWAGKQNKRQLVLEDTQFSRCYQDTVRQVYQYTEVVFAVIVLSTETIVFVFKNSSQEHYNATLNDLCLLWKLLPVKRVPVKLRGTLQEILQ